MKIFVIGAKYLCIMFDKVGGFNRDYNRTKYLILFNSKKICVKIKIKSDNDLPLEKTLTMHNVVILKSNFN